MNWPDAQSIPSLSDHQRTTLATATRGPIGILIGDPGTGKTATAAGLLKACADRFGIDQIAVCAPTGKAAVRITAAMQSHDLQLEGKTIHRTLGVSRSGRDGKGWGFRHDLGNPLNKRVVVIDETSMLGTGLAANLFDACAPGTLMLLIGDCGQLPPIDHGAPLRDMIAAGLLCGELTEIWRNEGDVVKACRAIRRGKEWRPSRSIDVPAGRNLQHFETSHASLSRRVLERLLERLPADIDARWDVQIMVAKNEASDVARKPLNELLQNVLNPCGRRVKGHAFRDGDKAICLSNSMLPLATDSKSSEFIANGDIGRVEHVEAGEIVIRFEAPERTTRVTHKLFDIFDLAYAITVHKSQGSQWPIAIFVSDDSHGARMVGSRELIYTALSRAQKLAITIGRKATIDADCQRESLNGRKTFLREDLLATRKRGLPT